MLWNCIFLFFGNKQLFCDLVPAKHAYFLNGRFCKLTNALDRLNSSHFHIVDALELPVDFIWQEQQFFAS